MQARRIEEIPEDGIYRHKFTFRDGVSENDGG